MANGPMEESLIEENQWSKKISEKIAAQAPRAVDVSEGLTECKPRLPLIDVGNRKSPLIADLSRLRHDISATQRQNNVATNVKPNREQCTSENLLPGDGHKQSNGSQLSRSAITLRVNIQTQIDSKGRQLAHQRM
jgi:hypothetical protein